MKIYHVKRISPGDVDLSSAERGSICEYPWGGDYRPEAFFSVVYIDSVGFRIRLQCAEAEPRTVYNGYMDPVYTDSCLEFFAAYAPGGYINCEVNSAGALLAAYGEGRENRVMLLDAASALPEVKAGRAADFWFVEITMYQSILDRVYGPFCVNSGYTFYANCYKCGDDCEIPHYGMWNPGQTQKPDFHRPEYFGKFIVE